MLLPVLLPSEAVHIPSMQELTDMETRKQTHTTGSLWVDLAGGSSVVNAPVVVAGLPVHEGAVVVR